MIFYKKNLSETLYTFILGFLIIVISNTLRY